MAEMTKKLHFLKSGTEQTAKAYSTTAEAGSNYITNVIDNTTCYIPLGATGDAQATIGRVTKGGTTYAIKSQAKPAYAEKSWTTAGTYTWTAPAGVTRVRVAVCGGGGGGLAMDAWKGQSGNSGATSAFGNLISANGGGSCGASVRDYWDGDNHYYVIENSWGGAGGSPNGYNGTSKSTRSSRVTISAPNTNGFALSFTKTNGSYGYGGGASMYIRLSGSDGFAVGSGGSGGYDTKYVDVVSGSTYTIVVGGGGSARKNISSGGVSVSYNNSGNSGFVLIAYGGDI